MNNDIVARLRSTGGLDARLLCDAADEIERLREELTASHESHGNEVGSLTERLSLAIHERDEARRMYCERMSNISRQQDCTPQWFAEEMEWDCFKEANDGK